MLYKFQRHFIRYELPHYKRKLGSWYFYNISLPLLRLRLRLKRHQHVFIWLAIIALFINQET